MGTDKESFVELTERIGRKTGGLSVYPFTSAKRGQEQPVAYVMVRRGISTHPQSLTLRPWAVCGGVGWGDDKLCVVFCDM